MVTYVNKNEFKLHFRHQTIVSNNVCCRMIRNEEKLEVKNKQKPEWSVAYHVNDVAVMVQTKTIILPNHRIHLINFV